MALFADENEWKEHEKVISTRRNRTMDERIGSSRRRGRRRLHGRQII
jgi:hypothetical protein